MSEIKLFNLIGKRAAEVASKSIALEKSLQTIIENNLEVMLGVRFLRSEYATGKSHSGRIDTLGIDENGCPVIIEYKRSVNENVINQGLFYLDWLLDHKADFKLLVMETFGTKEAGDVDWSAPRLICIAADFTKYDGYAVNQINRNIDLVRYRRFGDDLMILELVHRTSASETLPLEEAKHVKKSGDKLVSQWIEEMEGTQRDLFEALRSYLISLGDDVQEKQLKLYLAFRRIKNFACIVFQKRALLIYVKLDPETITLEEGFTRDVRNIGHWATGDLEITITTQDTLRKAESLLTRAYEES